MRSETTMTLHTRQAQRLVQGRRAEDGTPGIIGLTRYGALLRPLWNGARTDDPYADWWLIKIEDALQASWDELEALHEHVADRLRGQPSVQIQVAVSLEPLQLPLTFGNAYGFRGAYLLSRYDELVRSVLTARHVALLDRDASEKLLAEGGKLVRRAYTAVVGYKFLGINRQDVHLMTARANQAAELMGQVPARILTGEMRAAHAPEISRVQPGGLRRARPAPADTDTLAAPADAEELPQVTERVGENSDGTSRA